jgi:hypothetical protein
MRPEPWLLALALGCAAPAQAQDLATSERGAGGPMLGGALEDICRGARGQPAETCAAYLRGSFEGLMIGQASMTDGGDMSFCLPDEGVTLAQVREAFLTLMLSEPDRRTEYASVSLLDSLQDAYPCEDDEDLVPYVDTASAHRRPGRATGGATLRRTARPVGEPIAHMLR